MIVEDLAEEVTFYHRSWLSGALPHTTLLWQLLLETATPSSYKVCSLPLGALWHRKSLLIYERDILSHHYFLCSTVIFHAAVEGRVEGRSMEEQQNCTQTSVNSHLLLG